MRVRPVSIGCHDLRFKHVASPMNGDWRPTLDQIRDGYALRWSRKRVARRGV